MTKILMGAAGVLIASSLFFADEAIIPDAPLPDSISTGQAVVYFSAGGCGPCATFEAEGAEQKFKEMLEAKGVRYLRKKTENQKYLKHKNVYGDYTNTFRKTVSKASHLGVPMFAYVVDGEIVAADQNTNDLVAEALAAK